MMEFRPSGDTGLTILLGQSVDPATSRLVVALAQQIRSADLPGVVDLVPTYLSLLVHYDPLLTSQGDLVTAISQMDPSRDAADAPAGRSWRFPICFDGEGFAPDLAHVAELAGQTIAKVKQAVMDQPLDVYMLGFAPGQPYIGDVPMLEQVMRREHPVPNVPAGSVLTATGKVVIYPNANPTGWHIIGRTPVPLFNQFADEPALLAPGDRIRFHETGPEPYADLANKLAEGRLDPQKEFRT